MSQSGGGGGAGGPEGAGNQTDSQPASCPMIIIIVNFIKSFLIDSVYLFWD